MSAPNSDAPPAADAPSPEEVRDLLSTLYHDLNNPLSIIMGNAQFLRELIREADLGDPYLSSVNDIYEAAEQISDSFAELVRAKEELNDSISS